MIKRVAPKVMRLTDWEPDEKLIEACNAQLGLRPDGTFRPPPGQYQPQTRGTDAAADSNGARK